MVNRAGKPRSVKPVSGLITTGLLLLVLAWSPDVNSLAAYKSNIQPATNPSNHGSRLNALQPSSSHQSTPFLGPHGGYSALTDGCATCHRSHSAAGRDLTAIWPEEYRCFNCHSVDGDAVADMQTLFLTFPNTVSAIFSHPIMEASGVHDTPTRVEEEDLSDRHVECADCHNPHFVSLLNPAAPEVSGKLAGVSGVEPLYDETGSLVDYAWIAHAQFEYQVCLKCHSSYTALPTYIPEGWNGNQYIPDGLSKLTNLEAEQIPDSRDLAGEFNPAQNSYHPVIAAGQNSLIPSESFVDGWSIASRTYCSDCHSTEMNSFTSLGPHGGQLHILREDSPYVTVNLGGSSTLTGAELCFNCHRSETYLTGEDSVENTNFRRNSNNLHRSHANNGSCYQCHDTHGSEQRHLLNLDTSLNDQNSELLELLVGYDQQPTNSQTFWQISPDGEIKTCFIICHNRNHTRQGWSYPNYIGE